jgi:hypothetical protein
LLIVKGLRIGGVCFERGGGEGDQGDDRHHFPGKDHHDVSLQGRDDHRTVV